MVSTVAWVAQGFVALVMTLAGMAKLMVPRAQLARRMHWAATWARGRIKLLGLAEVAGAVGLIVPMATGIAPVLTPMAAVCVAVLMAETQGHRLPCRDPQDHSGQRDAADEDRDYLYPNHRPTALKGSG